MYIPTFYLSFIHQCAFGLLPCFGCCEYASLNVSVHISVQVLAFSYLGRIPRSGLLDHMTILYLTFEGTALLFFIVPVLYNFKFPQAVLSFLHILANTPYFLLLLLLLFFFLVTALVFSKYEVV